MIKKRAGLLLIAVCVAAAVGSAACAPKPNSNNNTGGSPTPTVSNTASPTPTGSPSPTPSPSGTPFSPLQTWVTPDGKELWARGTLGMNGTVLAYQIQGVAQAGCFFAEFPISVTATYGLIHTFLAYQKQADPQLTCVTGADHIDLDFGDGDQNCVGCVSDHFFTNPDPASTGTFYVGDPILSGVTGTLGQTGVLRLHALASTVVLLTEVRVYTNAGNVIDNCQLGIATGTEPEGNLMDASPCEVSAASLPAGLNVGTMYKAFFRGTYADDGKEFEQYVTFPFVATP